MKTLLAQSVQALILGDVDSAKSLHKQYMDQKSQAVFKKLDEEKLAAGIVKGHCDECGEAATTSKAILEAGKWECGHCHAKKFDVDAEQEAA